jgi:hypothetical protein
VTNLARRLHKLEKQLTDASGLVPHSEAWLNYWKRRLEQYLSEGDGIPMEAIDEIDAAGGDEELERWLLSEAGREECSKRELDNKCLAGRDLCISNRARGQLRA